MKIRDLFATKKVQYGGMSFLIIVAFIALVIIANFLVTALNESFPITVDLTKDKIFELSQESVDYIKTVEDDVEIMVIFDEREFENYGNYYTQAKNLIDNYQKHNSAISVSYIDPALNPSYAYDYPDLQLTYGDILITANDNVEQISIFDLFVTQYDQQSGQTYITSSKAEHVITSTIMRAMTEEKVKITFLTGHEEVKNVAFEELLVENGFEVIIQDILTEEIDKTADIAIMLGTRRDPDVEVIEKLNDFIFNDGLNGKTLVCSPVAQVAEIPNLVKFLEQMGIGIGDSIIMESDASYMLNNYPYVILADYTSDEYIDEYIRRTNVVLPVAREISVLFEYQSGFQVETLMTFSKGSYAMPTGAAANWRPNANDFKEHPAIIRSQFLQYDGLTPLISSVIVPGSSEIFADSFIASQSVANAEYILSAFNTITQRQDVIYIAPKNIENNQLGITSQMDVIVLIGIFIVAIPLISLIFGFAMYFTRKNK